MINPEIKRKFANFAGRLLVYALIIYVFVILGRSIWLNWYLKKEMQNIQQQIEELESQNNNLKNLIVYYRSDSFKEVEARQKLGMRKPGEKVVAISTRKLQDFQKESEIQQENFTGERRPENIANWQYWWMYFVK